MLHCTPNGLKLHYELSGQEGAPVVVFSNSLGTTLDMWNEVAGVIAQTYRVLRYDTRGHGGSGIFETNGAHYGDIDGLVDDLVSLLDALAIQRFHMVGLSLGGMTGQAFASRFPNRVASLALLATSAFIPSGAQTYAARAVLVRQSGIGAIADGVLARWFTPAFAQHAPERFADISRALATIAPEGYAQGCEIIGGMDLRSRLSAITCPTLIIAGTEDLATPMAHSYELHATILASKLIVLPDAAHLLAVEHSDAVTLALLDFLPKPD
jgi:3-oxoadipate enol-lactonase